MSRATVKPVLVVWMFSLVVLLACGGTELLNLGGDAGQGDAAGSGSGRAPTATADGGGGDVAASFPCGDTVCSAPDVCCVERGAITGCEPRASCDGGTITCTALTCPAGSLCCVSYVDDGGMLTAAQCVDGSSCPSGRQQACVPEPPGSTREAGPPCPAGDYCACDHVACTCQ